MSDLRNHSLRKGATRADIMSGMGEMGENVRRLFALAFVLPLFFVFAYLLPTSDTGPVQFADAQLGRYEVDYSLRFNDDDSPYLTKTFTQVGSTTKWTFSTWVKPGNLSIDRYLLDAYVDANNRTYIALVSSNALQFADYSGGSARCNKITSALFRDPAAWTHIVVAVDTTQATAANRNRIYVNGTEITSFSTDTNCTQNISTWITDDNDNAGSNVVHNLGRYGGGSAYFDGYLSEAYLVDGQQLTPSSFGFSDSNGYWRPKAYLGTSSGANSFFGTNGFYFNFASTTALGWNLASTSAATAAWTATNLDATDQTIDTPSHTFAAFNSLDKSGTAGTYSNGNLVWLNSAATGNYAQAYGSISMTSGKWYAEFYMNDVTNGAPGFILGTTNPGTNRYLGQDTYSYSYISDGRKVNNSSFTAYGASFTVGDTVSVTIDADAGSVTFYKNCSSQGVAFSGLTGPFRFAIDGEINGGANANFGQLKHATSTATANTFRDSAGGHFMCAPPSGYKALSTANLPDVAIQKPANYFDAVAYTGDAGATKSISSLAFAPSLVWLKNRSSAYSHTLFDAIRGAGSGMCLFSNGTNAEGGNCDSTYGYLSSFDSLGFTVTKGSDATSYTNGSGQNYIAWNWKESATSGFDIVTYTGDGNSSKTVGHSLGSAPDFVIQKSRNATGGWPVYHRSLGATGAVQLESTGAFNVSSTYWNDTAPDATNITIGSGLNTNGTTYILYAFDEKEGFSKFGSYTGNGSADGPFVYTGFKPRFIMFKRTDTASANADWFILDTSRLSYNPNNLFLFPDLTNAENAAGLHSADFLSNGFKVRNTGDGMNASGGTYVYAAFAEQPFKLSATNSFSWYANLFGASGETIFTKAVSITGNLSVQYQLSKGAGTFVIDHPLDPKNKLLYHSFVESPDQKNIYDGLAELDENGEAVVELPDYFLALNTDYRYLATPIGEPMPDLHLDRGVVRRWLGLIGAPAFKLSGGVPGGRVSWQVSGVRQDPYALDHPITPEAEKGPDQLVDKGEYLHPEFYAN